jgi:hypothetical protein
MRHAAIRSFMLLAEQTEFLAYRRDGISDLVDRALQLVPADAEVSGPVLHFVRLAHGNMTSVTLALVEKIVTHVAVLDEQDLAWGMRRGLSLPCRVRRLGGNRSFAVSLVMHEQREKQNDRKRNSD